MEWSEVKGSSVFWMFQNVSKARVDVIAINMWALSISVGYRLSMPLLLETQRTGLISCTLSSV